MRKAFQITHTNGLNIALILAFGVGLYLGQRDQAQENQRQPASTQQHPIPVLLRDAFKGTGVTHFEVNEYEAFFIRRVMRMSYIGGRNRMQSKRERLSFKNFADLNFLTDEQKRCFAIISSGGPFCPSSEIIDDLVRDVTPQSDLLIISREVAQKYGMRIARDFIEQALLIQDETSGQFEKRILRNTQDPQNIFSDSILNASDSDKAQIGIFFVAGYNHDRGVSADVMDAAAKHLVKQGFVSERLIVKPAGSSEDNAAIILETLEEKQKQLSRIVIVSLSKGSSDVSRFVVHELPKASPELQQKLRILVSLSGVVRDAFVPSWMVNQKGITTALIKTYMKQFLPEDHRDYDGMESMATDYWKQAQQKTSLLWISFPMIPESERGMPERKQALRLGTVLVKKANDSFGPHDGLVETGASILPPNSGMRQWIIRARGDHGLIDGSYLNGEPVSYQFVQTQDNIKAGVELIDAFMRALPSQELLK